MMFLTAGIALLGASLSIVCAYAVWLITARRTCPAPGTPAQPPVLIVVPVFDEAPLIERKLANLAALDYPNVHVVIVDGGSTDGTLALVRRFPQFELVETTLRNKTAQLAEALRLEHSAKWILVTDADAHLASDTLTSLMNVAAADGDVAVVGARVRPIAAHALESLHWRTTDWLRERESDRGTAAIVAAPCYLARRELLTDLPPDAIADDVHVACRAMLAAKRVGHADATVLELRSPRSARALLRHKYRKADAYLREIVRFLPSARRMASPMRAVFLWRAALLTLVPLFGALGGLAFVIGLLMTLSWKALFFALPFAFPQVRLAALLGGVSALALLTYPFSRQAASFPKILQPWEYRLPDETS